MKIFLRVKERLRVAFSLVVIFLLFALTAALVQVDMQPDNFFSVTMATIWFFNGTFLNIISEILWFQNVDLFDEVCKLDFILEETLDWIYHIKYLLGCAIF